jgi:hypothetical protein
MRKVVREFIRRLEAVGLTGKSTPRHYRVLRAGKPLRSANEMPFTLPFSRPAKPVAGTDASRFGDERDRGHRDDPSSSIEPPRSHTDRAQGGRDAQRVEDRQQRIERGKARAPRRRRETRANQAR